MRADRISDRLSRVPFPQGHDTTVIWKVLQEARESGDLVRLERRSPMRSIDGVIVDVSSSFVLVNLVSDDIRFDGFSVVRVPDLLSLESHFVGKVFLKTALEMSSEARQDASGVSIASAAACLTTAQGLFPLISVEREIEFPGEAQIGRVVVVDGDRSRLRLITPDAEWIDDECWIELDQMSRLSFGGRYEYMLALVAGS